MNFETSLSHNISASADLPISETTAFHARLGFSNTGYKMIDNSGPPPIIGAVFYNVDFVVSSNIFEVSLGTKFSKNEYFIIAEAGLGIARSNSIKFIERGSNGSRNTSTSKMKAENLKPDFFPISISLGRNVDFLYTQINTGLRAYYSFSKSGLNAGNNAALYGIGLFIGFKFE